MLAPCSFADAGSAGCKLSGNRSSDEYFNAFPAALVSLKYSLGMEFRTRSRLFASLQSICADSESITFLHSTRVGSLPSRPSESVGFSQSENCSCREAIHSFSLLKSSRKEVTLDSGSLHGFPAKSCWLRAMISGHRRSSSRLAVLKA